jgi:hypothetical protein
MRTALAVAAIALTACAAPTPKVAEAPKKDGGADLAIQYALAKCAAEQRYSTAAAFEASVRNGTNPAGFACVAEKGQEFINRMYDGTRAGPTPTGGFVCQDMGGGMTVCN